MFKKQKKCYESKELILEFIIRTLKEKSFDELPSTYFFNEIVRNAKKADKSKEFLIAILTLERDNFNRLYNEKIEELINED